MPFQSDLEYYAARANYERRMAEIASSPESARVHQELARGYEQLVEQEETKLQQNVSGQRETLGTAFQSTEQSL